ncbi:hypothetical protein HG537_0F02810 [Torulaspora globosa]|uniref:Oxidoreductase-like domain-containing protein n=1 Tax=Torulaspora globosa TaxID=48254 RepID=A0A7H9HVV9_9SACH|nr:hypothetical protein HG537_0F02810 [Torulaspora sp. CBS 2947]
MSLILFERWLLASSGGTRFMSSSTRCKMTFEGNTEGLRGTPEERMSRVFGGRLKGESPRSTSRIVSGGEKLIAGVNVPAKPVEPDNCCMSGCANCVWEVFNDDIREWKRQRKLAASRIKNTDQVWPANWNPPLSMLSLKNVPESLKTDKIRLDKQAKEAAGRSASLFPERTTPLPESVLEAKRRNALRHPRTARTIKSEIDEDEEGWQNVPVYIRAFAEFERKKKLEKQQKEAKSGSQ